MQEQTTDFDDRDVSLRLRALVGRLCEVTLRSNDAITNRTLQRQTHHTRQVINILRMPKLVKPHSGPRRTSINNKAINDHRQLPLSLTGFGLLKLCGALFCFHVLDGNGLWGNYVLCALFEDYLILAHDLTEDGQYEIAAVIPLEQSTIQSLNDDSGEQLEFSVSILLT